MEEGNSQIGKIESFSHEVPDSEKFLLCDGSTISRTTCAKLFAKVGTSWGAGNGSTTFHLPDLRGKFLRGKDDGQGNDPDAATRTASNTGGNAGDEVGSIQNNATKRPNSALTGSAASGGAHVHSMIVAASPAPYNQNFAGGSTSGTTTRPTGTAGGHSHAVSITGGGDSETRPKNVNVAYYIRFDV